MSKSRFVIKLPLPVATIMLAAWIAGVVLAQGFWSTAWAIVMPFWAWYLFIECLMKIGGMV